MDWFGRLCAQASPKSLKHGKVGPINLRYAQPHKEPRRASSKICPTWMNVAKAISHDSPQLFRRRRRFRDSVFIFSTRHRIKPSCTDTLMSYECAIQVYHSNHIEISTYRLPRKQTPQNELLDLYRLHRLFDHVCMSDSICTYHSSHRIRTVALRWLPVISKYHLVPTNSAKSRWCGITKLSIRYSSSKTKPGLAQPYM